MVAAQPFYPTGNDGAVIQFHTDSWTRPGHDGHELTLTLDGMTLHCSCEDATCRTKNRRHPGDPGLCKHARFFSTMVFPVIAQALGHPLGTRPGASRPPGASIQRAENAVSGPLSPLPNDAPVEGEAGK